MSECEDRHSPFTPRALRFPRSQRSIPREPPPQTISHLRADRLIFHLRTRDEVCPPDQTQTGASITDSQVSAPPQSHHRKREEPGRSKHIKRKKRGISFIHPRLSKSVYTTFAEFLPACLLHHKLYPPCAEPASPRGCSGFVEKVASSASRTSNSSMTAPNL